MSRISGRRRWAGGAMMAGVAWLTLGGAARASDHLDSPSVIADPRVDIGDIYAWTDPAGGKLDLVMTIVGHGFSDKAQYIFHIDSGPALGKTRASTVIVCAFASMTEAECRVGDQDYAHGDPSKPEGLAGDDGRFKVFAGLRDDPFFNNVKGTRAAYNVAQAALKAGAGRDEAGCPKFDAQTTAAIGAAWRGTDGGPGTNFLRGWTPAWIVISVDLGAVAKGGPILGVWGATVTPKGQVDRMGRPLTGNALLATLGTADESDRLKELYNASTPADGGKFVDEIAVGLRLYDGLDGRCGDQWLYDRAATAALRYRPLARLLADDRLWVNSAATDCNQLFAVELAALSGRADLARDCGGRTPTYDAVNVYRSQLANGTNTRIDDGVHRDEKPPSNAAFPFLVAPEPAEPETH